MAIGVQAVTPSEEKLSDGYIFFKQGLREYRLRNVLILLCLCVLPSFSDISHGLNWVWGNSPLPEMYVFISWKHPNLLGIYIWGLSGRCYIILTQSRPDSF